MSSIYLQSILDRYTPRSPTLHQASIKNLLTLLTDWSGTCYKEIVLSGSKAKGTAISLASDVDFLVGLSSDCNENSGGLKSIFESLHQTLSSKYQARVQNVSVRINLNGLEVDITPARRQPNSTNYYWLYSSKTGERKQTNIQLHIKNISESGRTNEIKLLKIWRELHRLDFPSIYLEYLLINVLQNKSKDADKLGDNFWFALHELAKNEGNPLETRVIDPANTGNVLSDLLTTTEKVAIIQQAKSSIQQKRWGQVVW